MISCPYCQNPAKPATGSEIYPHRPDLAALKFWLCKPCNAYVGSDPNGKPLGFMAGPSLRAARVRAHNAFDPLWKGRGATMTRADAYKWLADAMRMKRKDCHLAMMDEEQLARVVDAVRSRTRKPAQNSVVAA